MDKFSWQNVKQIDDVALSKEILTKIAQLVQRIHHPISIMPIGDMLEYVIAKNGLMSLLPPNIQIISGPGCPICICPASDIDVAIMLSQRPEIIITTFGDMLQVPASNMSLFEAKALGGDIRIVYGPHDAVKLAEKNPSREVVFFSIGFESIASLLAFEISNHPPKNFSIICANKVFPPVFDLLLRQYEIKIDAFILPGHVSVILGSNLYISYATKYHTPMVVSGFEVNDVLISIFYLLSQLNQGRTTVENTYQRVVKSQGNVDAQEIIADTFVTIDSMWRGIGIVPKGGLSLHPKFAEYDAIQKFHIHLPKEFTIPKECACTEVLMGKKMSCECEFFGKQCTPQHPVGPNMVSHGPCKIAYVFQRL